MDQHPCPQPFFEQAQQVQLIGQKLIGVCHVKAVMHDLISGFDTRFAAENPFQQRRALHVVGLQLGQEDAGQLAHLGGLAEVVLHKVLNRTPPGLILIAHALGHFDLQVKGQLFSGAARHQMHMRAHRP